MYVKNCIVVGSADDGIYADSDVDGLVVENSIFYNNGGYDINISSASGDLMRNVLYNTMNGSSAGSSNYNISASGDPFADGTNGDYRSNVRKETINTGTDIGQEHDILGNTIRVQDIGAFEYGGTKFNWTQR